MIKPTQTFTPLLGSADQLAKMARELQLPVVQTGIRTRMKPHYVSSEVTMWGHTYTENGVTATMCSTAPNQLEVTLTEMPWTAEDCRKANEEQSRLDAKSGSQMRTILYRKNIGFSVPRDVSRLVIRGGRNEPEIVVDVPKLP